MSEFWKGLTWASCFSCGSNAVSVRTTVVRADWAYDGDRLRCEECGARGWISADVDSATDEWDEEHEEQTDA